MDPRVDSKIPSAKIGLYTFRFFISGIYLCRGSFNKNFPSSCNIINAMETIGLVIEYILKILSSFKSILLSISA